MNQTVNLPKATSADVVSLTDRWFDDRKIFTKYDVTKQLRHDGYVTFHKLVKKWFDEDVAIPDDYKSTNLSIQGNPVVYCPDEKDFADYDENEVTEFKIQPTTSNQSTSATYTKTGSIVSAIKKLFDVRGRHSVSAQTTRNAGYDKGSVLYIHSGDDLIMINDSQSSDSKRATVDCYCNIRVPKSVFEEAFDSIPDEVETTINNGSIVISKKD